MKSINVHDISTHSQTAEPQNIRQMPQVFGLAMALIGLSAPPTWAATKPGAPGAGLVAVENPVSYADGRPYPSYRLNAVDQGMFLEYGKGPNECDTMNGRDRRPEHDVRGNAGHPGEGGCKVIHNGGERGRPADRVRHPAEQSRSHEASQRRPLPSRS